MNIIWSLAWKNLFRHKKRTLITCAAITYGIAMLIFSDGILYWADNESIRNLKDYEYGVFSITTEKFKEDRKNFPLDDTISPQDVDHVLSVADAQGLNTSPRTGFTGMVSFERGYGLPYAMIAVDPEKEKTVFSIHEDMVKGRYLNQNDQGVIIGQGCVNELGCGLGDRITVETKTKQGIYQALDLQVVGIYDVADPMVNRNQIFISRAFADTALQMKGSVSEIAVSTPTKEIDPYKDDLMSSLKASGLGSLVVETWRDLGKDYLTLSSTKQGGSKIMILFIMVIVAVGIINTMLMAVFERVRELGMLRSMGMRDGYVIRTFIIESAFIGLLGSVSGVILGMGIVGWVSRHGLDMSKAMGDMDIGYRTSAVFYTQFHPSMILFSLVFGIVCAVLVSLLPAHKAVQLEITDSLRYI